MNEIEDIALAPKPPFIRYRSGLGLAVAVPNGEKVLGMTRFCDRVIVATSGGAYELLDGKLIPISPGQA